VRLSTKSERGILAVEPRNLDWSKTAAPAPKGFGLWRQNEETKERASRTPSEKKKKLERDSYSGSKGKDLNRKSLLSRGAPNQR